MNRKLRRAQRKHTQPPSPDALTTGANFPSPFPTIDEAHLLQALEHPQADDSLLDVPQPLPPPPPAPPPTRADNHAPSAHSTPPVPLAPPPTEILPPLSQISAEPINWLWPGRIPYGALTPLEGDHNSGKSLLALTLAACVTRGLPFPDGAPCAQGPVLLITPSDNLSTIVRPRLEAAGGDPSHAFLLTHLIDRTHNPFSPFQRTVSLPTDLPFLKQQIEYLAPLLVIIDPLSVVFQSGSHDRSGAPEPATLLAQLDQIAQDTGCAILLVRPARTRASDLFSPRVFGSPAFDLVRASLLLVSHPKDPNHCYLVPNRHCLGPTPALLAYRIVSHTDHAPTLLWLDDAQSHLDTLLGKTDTTYSQQRHSSLHFLRTNPTAHSIDTIITTLALDSIPARKMLQRMTHDGDLTSPSRGFYAATSPTIPTTTTLPTDPPAPPNPTNGQFSTAVPNVPNDQNTIAPEPLRDEASTDPLTQPDSATHVPNVPTSPITQTNSASNQITIHVPNVPNSPEQEPSMDHTLVPV